MAILVVRRLLLELGHALQPDEFDPRISPLQLWVSLPRPDLEGLSPMDVLAQSGGDERLRQCLISLVGVDAATPTLSSTRSASCGG
jgi:hypothetical protein